MVCEEVNATTRKKSEVEETQNLLLNAHIGKLIRKENPDNNPFFRGLARNFGLPSKREGIKLMDDPSS